MMCSQTQFVAHLDQSSYQNNSEVVLMSAVCLPYWLPTTAELFGICWVVGVPLGGCDEF